MRLWALALLWAAPSAAQDPSPEAVIEAMQARAPRFRDLDLRYLGSLTVPGEAQIRGESRLVLIPGTGLRTDGTMFSFVSPDSAIGAGMEIEVSSVELGDDLYFGGVLHGGTREILSVIPPCLSLKGSRKAQGATLDAFPADFPFRWIYEDAFALYALAPREAFARDPGLRVAGRQTVDGKDCHVLEVQVPREKMPASSLLRSFPIGAPLKRYCVEAETGRLRRIEMEFQVDRVSFTSRWEAVSWREVSGISLPAEVRIVMGSRHEGQVPADAVTLRKVLSSAAVDRGLAAADLLPEERRKDIHLEAVVRPVEFYTAAVGADPRSAAAWAGRAMARYREKVARALQDRREPRVDPAEVIPDLEKAQAVDPSSPFVTLSLMKLYEAAGKETEIAALARALEGRPAGADVRLALARHWVRARDGESALRAVEGLEAPAGSPLGTRLTLGRLRASAFALSGRKAEAGRALTELVAGAAPGEGEIIADVLAPPPLAMRRKGGADAVPEEDKAVREALEAAVEAEPRCVPLQEARLRLASRGGDAGRIRKALESYVEAVDAPEALDRAARLAIDLPGWEEAPAEELAAYEALGGKIVKKAPDSVNGSLLLGVSLLKGGKAEAGQAHLAAMLDGLEKRGIEAEDADRQAKHLAVLTRAFTEAGREGEVLRACRLYIKCVNKSRQPYLLLQGDANDPISTCVTALLAKSRHVEIFGVLKELDAQKFDYLYNLRRVMRPSEQAFVKAVKEEVLAKSKDAEDFRKLAKLIQRATSRPMEALPLLEKARELSPGNVEILGEMAALCMGGGGDRERAIQLYEELVKTLEKAPSPKFDRDQSLLVIAQLHQTSGHPEEAAAALDRMNRDAPGVARSLLAVATIYDGAGKTEKAIAAYRRFVDQFSGMEYMVNSGTYGRLGSLYEKTEQHDEAFRMYSRGLEVLRKERDRGMVGGRSPVVIPGQARPPESTDPAVRREALLKRLGPEYFLRKFLEKTFEPLSADEERAAKEFYEKLGSDSAAERERAEAGIRKIGTRVAPLLRAGLDSSDPDFRTRVRQILAEWAEPR